MGDNYFRPIDKTKIYFISNSDGPPFEVSDFTTSDSFMFGFDPARNKEENMATDPFARAASVKVDDLLTVYPQLHICGESNAEFAEKIRLAAEWNRGNDADTDLISRLNPDMVDEVSEHRNNKEEF